MTTATKKKSNKSPADRPVAKVPPLPTEYEGKPPVVKTGNRAHRRGNAAVAVEFPNGQRAALSPVTRPRNGRFYRHAFALHIGGERVAEFVYPDLKQANTQHTAIAEALQSLATPEDPK